MNNLYNRKLFKPRPARSKLNQMGGIMASSVPLMQSVQKFANGNLVRIPGQPLRDVTGRGFRMTGPIFSGEPITNTRVPPSRALIPSGPVTTVRQGGLPTIYNPVTDPSRGFRMMGPPSPPVSQGPTSQRVLGKGLMVIQQQPSGPGLASLGMGLLKRAPVLSAVYGVGRGIADPLEQEPMAPSYRAVPKQSIVGKDLFTGGLSPEEVFVEDFDAMSKEKQDELLASFNATQRGKQEFARAGEAVAQAIDPTVTTISDVLSLGLEERSLEKKANVLEAQFPELSKDEFRRALKSRDPEKFEESEQKKAGLSPTMRGPTAEDMKNLVSSPARTEEAYFSRTGEKTDKPETETKTKTKAKKTSKKEAKEIINKAAPTKLELAAGQTEADNATIVGAIEGLTSENDKADVILETLGRKSEDKKLTLKERVQEIKAVAKDLGLFKDDEADQSIDRYNQMILGVAIATKGLGEGIKEGLNIYRNTAESRKKTKDTLDKFSFSIALQNEAAEEQAARDLEKFELGQKYDFLKTMRLSNDRRNIAAANIAATHANLLTKISADATEGAKDRNAIIRRTLYNNFDEAMSMAFTVAQNNDLDITNNEVLENEILPLAVRFSQQLGSPAKPGTVGSLERIYQDAFESLDRQASAQNLPFDLRDKTGRYTPQAIAAVDDYVNRVLGKVKGSPDPAPSSATKKITLEP